MAKTAFVTGATGFVGLNLIEALLARGWDVIALHRASSELGVLERFGVQRVIGDVTDARSIKLVMPPRVDCVFHVAGNTSLWTRTHAEQLKVNVRGTRNVARVALEVRAQRLVHISSIVAYGLHGGMINEETPTRGSAVAINYIRSKAMAEREVRKAMNAGLRAVIVNPAHLIGAYDTSSWARMFRLVASGRLPAVPPGGGSFCHARAAAEAMVTAAEQGRIGHNYLLGGAQTSYLGLVKTIAASLGIKRRVVAVHPGILRGYARIEEWIAPIFGREPDVTSDAVALLSQNLYCDSRKAQRELGYRPRPLPEMVDECRDWLRKARLL